MHILIAPNAFKGSLSAHDTAIAIRDGVTRIAPDARLDLLPVADGGDGTADVLVQAVSDGRSIDAAVIDPLSRPITARFGLINEDKTAVIELAAASGLRLLNRDELDPLRASTFGTGQLIRTALDYGCRQIIIGVGGSATVDGGAGIAQALGARLLDAAGNEIGRGGGALATLDRIDLAGLDPRLKDTRIDVACDVDNPLLGEKGAARVFAPQKGASAGQVEQLEAHLTRFADVLAHDTGVRVHNLPHAGAAGGAAAGLHALCGAHLRVGIDLILDQLDFAAHLEGVDLVITGEGRIDDQTIYGKAPIGVAKRAKARGIPVVALAGGVAGRAVYDHGIDAVMAILPAPMALDEAMRQAAPLLADAAERLMRLILLRPRFG
jgi:glycerate 2-kinase